MRRRQASAIKGVTQLKPIRILVVNDHELVRIAVRTVADEEEDIELVGEYANAESALDAMDGLDPDVVLMGVDMKGMDGVHACRHIRDRLPDVKVVMLTSHSEEETVMASIIAGAAGYLLRNTSVAELLHAVRAVAGGASLLDPAVTQGVLDRFKSVTTHEESHAPEPPPNGAARLSKRESEVFSLIVEGCTNREIGERLYISENTARNHVSHILHKLGLSRRGQAAAIGLRGIVT